jgi:hypothetical protein
MIENGPTNTTQATSLLAIWGLLPRLRAACGILGDTADDIARSATLYMPVIADKPDSVIRAITLFAQEHCVEAEVDYRPNRIVVRLHRPINDAAKDEDSR